VLRQPMQVPPPFPSRFSARAMADGVLDVYQALS